MYVALFFSLEVLVTLTSDAGRLLSKLHQAQPKGEVKFLSGVKIAHVSIEGEINRCVAMLYYLYRYSSCVRYGILVVYLLQLALKHRQGKNHKMRIVVFIASPIEDDEKEARKFCILAKY